MDTAEIFEEKIKYGQAMENMLNRARLQFL